MTDKNWRGVVNGLGLFLIVLACILSWSDSARADERYFGVDVTLTSHFGRDFQGTPVYWDVYNTWDFETHYITIGYGHISEFDKGPPFNDTHEDVYDWVYINTGIRWDW